MTALEKVAYLRGLCEGMDMDENSREGKLFRAVIDVLTDLAGDLEDTKDSVEDMADCLDELTEELSELEDEFYECVCDSCSDCDECDCCCDDDEDDDDDDEDVSFFRVECPGCGFLLTVDEDTLSEGSFECPEGG